MPSFTMQDTGRLIKRANHLQSEHVRKIGETHLNAKLQMLTELLEEIEDQGCDRVIQVKVIIHSNIKILNLVKDNSDE